MNVNLKELHKFIRLIPVCTSRKASLAWLRQHIVSANISETQFLVECTGSPQEKSVLVALLAEFSKFTLLMMSHHL